MKEYLISLFTTPAALVGLLASMVVLVSMCFNTQTKKGTIWMRALNLLGSIVSVVYGILLGVAGSGIILLNGILIIVNIYYLIKNNK